MAFYEKLLARFPELSRDKKCGHDVYFRVVFHMKAMAIALAKQVLPKVMHEKIDWEKTSVDSPDFLSGEWTEARADILVRLPFIDSSETLTLYIVFEHKSWPDFWAIHQAAMYAVHLASEEIRTAKKEKRFHADFRLSEVIMVIFYHGERPFTGPTDWSGVYHKTEGLEGGSPHWKAQIFDLQKMHEEEVPEDKEEPAFREVLRALKYVFSMDMAEKGKDILQKLIAMNQRALARLTHFYLFQHINGPNEKEKTMALSEPMEAAPVVEGEDNCNDWTIGDMIDFMEERIEIRLIEKGSKKALMEVARRMKQANQPIDIIVLATELTAEEIESL